MATTDHAARVETPGEERGWRIDGTSADGGRRQNALSLISVTDRASMLDAPSEFLMRKIGAGMR